MHAGWSEYRNDRNGGSYQSIFLSLAVHQLKRRMKCGKNHILFFMTSLQMVVDSRGIPPFDYSQSMN